MGMLDVLITFLAFVTLLQSLPICTHWSFSLASSYLEMPVKIFAHSMTRATRRICHFNYAFVRGSIHPSVFSVWWNCPNWPSPCINSDLGPPWLPVAHWPKSNTRELLGYHLTKYLFEEKWVITFYLDSAVRSLAGWKSCETYYAKSLCH